MEHGVNLISELICLPVDHLYGGMDQASFGHMDALF